MESRDIFFMFICLLVPSSVELLELNVKNCFHPGLWDRGSVNTYFQFTSDEYSLTWAIVTYCVQHNTLVIGTECHAQAMLFREVLQRMRSDSKSILFQLDVRACEMMDDKTIDYIERYPYGSIWIGVRGVKGPESTQGTIVNEPKCLKMAANITTVMMYDEWPPRDGRANIGYTKEMLEDLQNAAKLFKTTFVALDMKYLHGIRGIPMNETLVGLKVIVYKLHKQRDPWSLKSFRHFFAAGSYVWKKTVTCWDRRIKDRIYSYAPMVDWHQRPGNMHGYLINRAALDTYLAEGKYLLHLSVYTRGKNHYLNTKSDPALEVRLEKALQFVDKDKVMSFYFPREDYHLTYFDKFIGESEIFIRLYVVKGPNYHPNIELNLQDVSKIQVQSMKVIYVLCFLEDMGKFYGYSYEHGAQLVEVVNHPIFKGRKVAVQFAAEHLGNSKGVFQFDALMKLGRFTHTFVYNLRAKWPYGHDKTQNLKYNIRELNRPAYLNTQWSLRQDIYKYEYIDAPPLPPPTTPKPTTSGTGPTPEPTTTTPPPPTESSTKEPEIDWSVPPPTLTSPTPMTPTGPHLNTTTINFPTPKANGAAWLSDVGVEWRWWALVAVYVWTRDMGD